VILRLDTRKVALAEGLLQQVFLFEVVLDGSGLVGRRNDILRRDLAGFGLQLGDIFLILRQKLLIFLEVVSVGVRLVSRRRDFSPLGLVKESLLKFVLSFRLQCRYITILLRSTLLGHLGHFSEPINRFLALS